MSRTWTLTVVAPCEWLTANMILGELDKYARARIVKAWRQATYVAAFDARLPTGLDRVRIEVEARFRGRPPVRDRSNLDPTIKACVDGLGPARGRSAGWGLIPDDDDKHLDGPHLTIGPPLPLDGHRSKGLLNITIKEIP